MFILDFSGFFGPGKAGGPGGTRGNSTNKKKRFFFRLFFVSLYVGNKSALFDHKNLSIDYFEGRSS